MMLTVRIHRKFIFRRMRQIHSTGILMRFELIDPVLVCSNIGISVSHGDTFDSVTVFIEDDTYPCIFRIYQRAVKMVKRSHIHVGPLHSQA